MENRQKNYGSVHDTKASMMYNRFLKQYNEWLSGGPIPDTGKTQFRGKVNGLSDEVAHGDEGIHKSFQK